MSTPLGVLTGGPTMWGPRNVNVLPSGMSGLQFGPSLGPPQGSMGDSGPAFNGHYVMGKSDYYDGNTQHTNDRATRHFSQNVSEWQEGHTIQDQLTWFLKPPPNPMIPHDRVSYRMFCWSSMNYHLKHDPRWRADFGTHRTAEHLRKTFALMGVQQSKQTMLKEKGVWNEENNFIINNRARMPNLWLAQSSGPCVGEGASLYIIYRRCLFDGSIAADPDMWEDLDAPGARAALVDRDANADVLPPPPQHHRKRKEYPGEVPIYSCASSLGALPALCMAPRQAVPAADFEPAAAAATPKRVHADAEYYWRIDPYVTYDRQPPPPALYTGDFSGDPDNQYIGDYEHIGTVAHVLRGNNDRSARNVNRARNALYPDAPGKSYYEDYFKLDCIEVMLRMGK